MNSENLLAEIKYPVVCFYLPSYFESVPTEDLLTQCTRTALKRGNLTGIEIYDSAGKKLVVKSARKIGTVGPFWGLNLFLGQQLRVAYEFKSDPEPVSLTELRRRVLRAVKADEYFWDSGGCLDEMRAAIEAADSYDGLIDTVRHFQEQATVENA